jgi:L-ribulose-5-phosphate 3-epimerase
MSNTDRRTFLKATGAALAGATMAATTASISAEATSKPWRKAFMLGGVAKGPILPHFELLKEAGFEGVELISPNQLDRDEVLRARDKTGLVIHGVSGGRHWKDTLSDPDPAVVDRGLAAIRQEMEDCKAYGGTTVLLVPAVVTKDVSYRDAYTRSQANIRKLLPDAERHGVKIAIEEVWNKFLLSPTEFSRYIDELNSPWVGAYFDVGNVVEYGYPQEWIRELGKRILKVHIKEYAKAKRFGYPLGEGEIDWPDVRQALLDVGYQGWITAEVPRKGLAEMKDVVARMDKVLGMSCAGNDETDLPP